MVVLICARTGRVRQAYTDLFVPSTIHIDLSYHHILSESPSEPAQPPKQPARANASGLCVGACVWFANARTTTKRGYGSASVAVRAEKKANKSDKIMMLFSETETAKQNQKIPFHFFFRFAVEGWGEETREKCKEIFWFLHTRVRQRVRGALYRFPTQSERTEKSRTTTRSARAISRQNPADFVRNTFELRPIHTARSKILGFCPSIFWSLPEQGWDEKFILGSAVDG
jgi:hypothetical protein